MKTLVTSIIALILIFTSCQRFSENEDPNDNVVESELYFPPNSSDEWSTSSLSDLGWDESKLEDLLTFLEANNTRAFMILKDGKIAVEQYWGKDIDGANFNKESYWYWASAGKTLTSFLVGQAQSQGYIDINKASSEYAGAGWTNMDAENEGKINVIHQLTMTTGLNDKDVDLNCTDPECLDYLAEPGTRWSYHNAPYTNLDKVITGATGQTFDTYFNQNLRDPIGMNGFWLYLDYNHVYFSNARSMARFGLMVLADGNWAGNTILSDKDYLEQSINSSQELNPSYGYLWWLNGKGKTMYPGLQFTFNINLTESAPMDMYAAMGKNGQLLNIVPSENLIVIRMGENPDLSLVPVNFQEEMWQKINILKGN